MQDEENKYDPLILEKNFQKSLFITADKINLQQKHEFLQNLYDSFKQILSCNKCDGILKANSLAFSCGHNFCPTCSANIDSCINCVDDGCKIPCKLGNLSETLSLITEIKKNFNAETVFLEILKCLLTPTELLLKKETDIQMHSPVSSTPSAPQSNTGKSKKFTSTGKRFKTLINKTESTKRKLQFNKEETKSPSFVEQNNFENDSECLFVETANYKKDDDDKLENKKIRSYLEQQLSVVDSPNFTTLKTYSRKSIKRKRCSNANKDQKMTENINFIEKFDNLVKDEGSLRKKKVEQISEFPENGSKSESAKYDCNTNDGIDKIKRRSSKKLNDFANNKNTVNYTKSPEGMFLGFDRNQLLESYSKLKNTLLHVGKIDEKKNVLKNDVRIQLPIYLEDTINSSILENAEINDKDELNNSSPLLKKSKNKLVKKIKVEGKPSNYEEKNREKNKSKRVEIKSNTNEDEQEQTILKSVDDNKHQLKLLNDGNEKQKKDDENQKEIPNSITRKEKENLLLSLPDTDAGEVVDVNIWERSDKVNKKKKSLFKSVKERNRKNLLFVQNGEIHLLTKPSLLLPHQKDNILSKNSKIPYNLKDNQQDLKKIEIENVVNEKTVYVSNLVGSDKSVNEECGTLYSNSVNSSHYQHFENQNQLNTNKEQTTDEELLNIQCTNENSMQMDYNSENQFESIGKRIDRNNAKNIVTVSSILDNDNQIKCDEKRLSQSESEQNDKVSKFDAAASDQNFQNFTHSREKATKNLENMSTVSTKLANQLVENQIPIFKGRKRLYLDRIKNDNICVNEIADDQDHKQNKNMNNVPKSKKNEVDNSQKCEINAKNNEYKFINSRCLRNQNFTDFSNRKLRIVLQKIDEIGMTELNENYQKSSIESNEGCVNLSKNNENLKILNIDTNIKFKNTQNEITEENSASLITVSDAAVNNDVKDHIVHSSSTNETDFANDIKILSNLKRNRDELMDINLLEDGKHFTDRSTLQSPQNEATMKPINNEHTLIKSSANTNVKNTKIFKKANDKIHEINENYNLTDSTSIINKSCNEDESVEINSTKTDIKSKCFNLKKMINDQNQKTLVNMKKSFKVSSPKLLSVEKSKLNTNISPSPQYDFVKNNSVGEVSSDKLSSSLKQEEPSLNITSSSNEDQLNKVQSLPLSKTDELLTLPSSPTTKSIACQTTPDLHIALLRKEFPHLFSRPNQSFSIYDTPVELVAMPQNEINQLKTPRTPFLNPQEMYTRISSVTTSEKKRYEEEFANHSVLCNSVFSNSNCNESANSCNESVSCYSLLPSTGKKPISNQYSSFIDKRKSSVRLNFPNDVEMENGENEIIRKNPDDTLLPISVEGKIDLMTKIQENDITYCSGLKTVCFKDSETSGNCDENCEKNKLFLNEQSNESNGSAEINFEDCGVIKDDSNIINKEKTSSNNDVKNNFNTVLNVMSDFNVITNNSCIVHDTDQYSDDILKESSKNEQEMINHSMKKCCMTEEDCMNIDDDDVDFVAGTPTTFAKRCVDDSLEKFKTQSMNAKITETNISLTEKSDHVLFDSADSKIEKSQPMIIAGVRENIFIKNEIKNNSSILCSSLDTDSCENSIIYLTTSGLKEVETNIVKLFCEKFQAVLLPKLTIKSTCLIVKTDNKNQTCRTFKYIQAIVDGISIVSIKWLQDCLQSKQILNMEEYIPFDSSGECGPLRAYNAKKGLIPPPLSWFCDYCILFIEPVPQACTLMQLTEVITKAGAVVIYSITDFAKYPSFHHIIIVSDEEENIEISNAQIAYWIQMYQAVAIEFNWLLEIIGRNRLVPFAEYEFVEIPKDLLLQLKFPDEILSYEKENVDDSD